MRKNSLRVTLTFFVAALLLATASQPTARAKSMVGRRLGTVTGLVRNSKGQPLAGAIIRFMREGADTVSKQTSTAPDGTFTARVSPGKYLLTAIAEGFREVSFNSVQVNPSDELSYRFNLEPLGMGRTAPERRADRNDPKWKLRSAANARSIFQQNGKRDANAEIAGDAIAQIEAQAARDDEAEDSADAPPAELSASNAGRAHGVVETYTNFSTNALAGAYVGTNFAPCWDAKRWPCAGSISVQTLI